MNKNIMNIVERFQTRHALEEEKHQYAGNPNQWRKSKMSTRNSEQFLYLQRGSEKSPACTVATENNSPKAASAERSGYERPL